MDRKEKLNILHALNEDRLRKEVLIPLFRVMGFKDVIEYHGTAEKGKDIIFYKTDEFDAKIYTGVVVKKEPITGSVSKPGSAQAVLFQAKQTFNEPYTDVYGLKELVIDRCIVITSRHITNGAIESIKGELKTSNLDKLVNFFDGHKVVDLLDTYLPGYFFKEYEAFMTYFNAMKEDFQTIRDVSAIGQREAVPLEHIYVSLKVSEKSERGMEGMDMTMEDDEASKIFDGKDMERPELKRQREVRRGRVMDADAAVKNYHRLVVVGAPGAGKTTLLKHMALKACKENIQKQERLTVPIPITLRELVQSGKTLREYINAVFEKYRFPEAKDSVEKDLQKGKCLLLLDGFDELASRENQEKVTKQIHAFMETYRGCRVLVSSRIAGYQDQLAGFTKLELMEFDENQVKQFIHNWFGDKDSKKARSMLKAVTENENIKALARNPLMIAIIAIIYEEDRELPQRRAALYQRAVEVLLSKWDVREKLKNKFPMEKKEFILRKLAFGCHCRNRRTMTEKEILAEIDQYYSQIGINKEKAKPFLEEIWQRSYLLRQIAMDTYDLLHLSFQEYFTALELKEQEDGIGTIIQHISEPWWEEPILLYAGISRDAGPLIRRIQNEVPEDMFYSNLMLSGKCAADSEFTDAGLKEEIAQKMWAIYENREFELLRNKATDVLRRMKPKNVIDSLLKQLTDEDRGVRWRAASALRAIGSAEAVPQLLKYLTDDKDSDVRWRAAFALGAIGSAEAVPQLLKSLADDKESYVRGRATEVLGALGSAEAIPQLLKSLADHKESYVRGRTASVLGALGSAEAVPQLLKSLADDKESYVRGRAASALGAIGSADFVPHLLKSLAADKDWSVRDSCANALGKIGAESAVAPLKKALKDESRIVSDAAFEALEKISRRLGKRIRRE